jgi:hypothetical protein
MTTMRMIVLCLACGLTVPPQVTSDDSARRTRAYLGFDSRLAVRVVTHHRPMPGLVAFLTNRGRSAFFYPTRVVLQNSSEEVEAPIKLPIRGVVGLSDGSIWVHRGRRLENWPVPQATRSVEVDDTARVSASLTRSILIGQATAEGYRLSVRTPSGATAGLALLPKEPVCLDWSPAGFAAVVDKAILAAPMGSREMTLVGADERYATATDLLQLDARRLLIATRTGVLVVTPEYRAVVALVRCRLGRGGGGRVQFFDLDSGLLWEATGLDRIGNRQADMAYVEALGRRCGSQDCVEAREAARLQALLGPRS